MDNEHWHFPLINPKKKFPLWHYLEKISEEMGEFSIEKDEEARKKEAMDVLHAAETFARKFFNDDSEFQRVRREVTKKNLKRGYYDD